MPVIVRTAGTPTRMTRTTATALLRRRRRPRFRLRRLRPRADTSPRSLRGLMSRSCVDPLGAETGVRADSQLVLELLGLDRVVGESAHGDGRLAVEVADEGLHLALGRALAA